MPAPPRARTTPASRWSATRRDLRPQAAVDHRRGVQPRAAARTPNGRYLLTFNGEIYNYIELREELIDEFGAEFATQGDGEVIVAGYHYWGEQVLDRLRGMFAFVIWDRAGAAGVRRPRPFGIKPLHYLQTADGLYLASEKKALLPFAPAATPGRRRASTRPTCRTT